MHYGIESPLFRGGALFSKDSRGCPSISERCQRERGFGGVNRRRKINDRAAATAANEVKLHKSVISLDSPVNTARVHVRPIGRRAIDVIKYNRLKKRSERPPRSSSSSFFLSLSRFYCSPQRGVLTRPRDGGTSLMCVPLARLRRNLKVHLLGWRRPNRPISNNYSSSTWRNDG